MLKDWRRSQGYLPTRSFKIGEKVIYGNHENSEIIEILDDHHYVIKSYGTRSSYGTPKDYEQISTVKWQNIFKNKDVNQHRFKIEKNYFITYTNRDIQGVLNLIIEDYAGIDFSPEYQRQHIWTLQDKQNLIDSIFKQIDIGRVLLAINENAIATVPRYELIDGKQRLSTLIDFFEDRFPYKDSYYSDLSFYDKNYFDSYQVQIGIMSNPSEIQKLEAFIAVNTFGRIMDNNHLQEVKNKLTLLKGE